MLFSEFITIQILQVMVISSDSNLLESVTSINYKFSIPTKPQSGNSPLVQVTNIPLQKHCPFIMRMHTQEGCNLCLHILPYKQNALLLEPEWPINASKTSRFNGFCIRMKDH